MDILSEIKNIDKLIKTKLDRITLLRDLATRITPCYEVERVQVQADDKMANIVTKIMSIENDVINELDKLLDMQLIVEDAINKITNNKHKALLMAYYINNKTIDEAAQIAEFECRYVYKVKEKAENQLKKFLNGQ